MIITTTPSVEGKRIVEYLGVATGDAIVGVNIFRDIFARIRDIIGGRAGGYEAALSAAKEAAFDDLIDRSEMLGADAVVGLALESETVGNSMLMVSVSGTAVRLG